jgi:hypothetical protein
MAMTLSRNSSAVNGAIPGLWGIGCDDTPCVNLPGNRQLNSARHIAALSQMRHPGPGHGYYLRKIAAGTIKRAALRCLIG